jgi:hypothetical protein
MRRNILLIIVLVFCVNIYGCGNSGKAIVTNNNISESELEFGNDMTKKIEGIIDNKTIKTKWKFDSKNNMFVFTVIDNKNYIKGKEKEIKDFFDKENSKHNLYLDIQDCTGKTIS